MKYTKPTLLASLLLGLSTSPLTLAEESASFVDAIKDGKTTLNFRLRMEDVTQATGGDDLEATANTLRTRLTYDSGKYNGWGGLVEFDYVTELDDVDYNVYPGTPEFPNSASILDPEGEDLNQAYLSYTGDGTVLKYGRQRILLDNQRYVGGVGWRQNEQTYDGFSINHTGTENLSVFVAYIYNVNRIFGSDHPAGDHKNNTVLLNAKYNFEDIGALTGYYYAIENKNAAHFSADTLGLRFTGSKAGFGYTAELASQTEGDGSPLNYNAFYGLLEGSFKVDPVTFKVGYELLGADGSDGMFITPLATLHAFQGWTDKYLNGGLGNIAGGIQDFYVNVGGNIGKVKAAVVYHSLSSDDSEAAGGMEDLGSEVGVVVSGKVGPVGLLAKYASYTADDFGTDTEKLWLQAVISF